MSYEIADRHAVLGTAVGFTGGTAPDPTDEEVESGVTGHVETVRVAFHPATVSYAELERTFFEEHDPGHATG